MIAFRTIAAGVLLAGALVLSAAPAMAQAEAAAADASGSVEPERLAAAKDLLKILRVEETLDGLYRSLAPTVGMSMLGILTGKPDTAALAAMVSETEESHARFLQLVAEEFLAAMTRRYPQLIDLMAQDYARTFTAQELRDVIAFYSTPAGAKMLAQQSGLQDRAGEYGGRIGSAAGEEAARKAFDRFMRERGEAPARTGT